MSQDLLLQQNEEQQQRPQFQQQNGISRAQADLLISVKEDFYKAMVANGWFLPAQQCQLCSRDFMIGVRNKSIFCPQFKDIKLLPCLKPPSREILVEKAKLALIHLHNHRQGEGADAKELASYQKLHELLQTHEPD